MVNGLYTAAHPGLGHLGSKAKKAAKAAGNYNILPMPPVINGNGTPPAPPTTDTPPAAAGGIIDTIKNLPPIVLIGGVVALFFIMGRK
jgi:hypothetical protein